MLRHTNKSKEAVMSLDVNKRNFLRLSAMFGMTVAIGIYGSSNAKAAEWKAADFSAKNLKDALKEIGVDDYTMSSDVAINSAEIAENGAVVPVSVSSVIPNTEYMAIFVEKNPNPLAAAFNIPAGTVSNIKTRIKMGETSKVFVLAKANGKWFAASKEIKVTLGGCGG
jgi:sulfur-oxidizing protein SoxY